MVHSAGASTDPMQAARRAAAIGALVDALQAEPFYVTLLWELRGDPARWREGLARYFEHSMREAESGGRLVIAPDPAPGAAIWQLPLAKSASDARAGAKATFIREALGTRARDTYQRIDRYMAPRTLAAVGESAWYLSIIGVSPASQGRGIGAGLLEPTLAEADAAGVACYLETFDRRNPRFYRRFGFGTVATHFEPTVGADYAIMRRPPG